MRHALVSLIAAAAVATPVFAQDATPTPAPEAPAATVVTGQAADGSTVTTTVTSTPDATVTTSVTTPPAAEPVIAAPEPAPAPVQQASDPTTLQVLNVLETACRPYAAGGDVAAITKPLGFKKKKDVYVLALTKPQQITIIPSATNQGVCYMEIDHAIGGDKDLTIGLHNWAMARGYTLYRNDEYVTDRKRHTRSWELTQDGKTEALVLVTEFKPDGSSIGKKTDHSTVMFSVR